MSTFYTYQLKSFNSVFRGIGSTPSMSDQKRFGIVTKYGTGSCFRYRGNTKPPKCSKAGKNKDNKYRRAKDGYHNQE